ncbi:MAG: hypothetical protein HFG72_06035 [Hungatella sp.]|jgi:hypothetical protein|nr:hypothetical protein [Hungatella sp.]
MDIECGNLEILFRAIPFQLIQPMKAKGKDYHGFDQVNQKIYLEYSKQIFQNYSKDEHVNNYYLLDKDMWNDLNNTKSVFYLISEMASRMLIIQSQKIKCRLGEMLRWREISFQLGQDLFTCSFLAREDLRKGRETSFFAWQPIISSDDVRLNNILKRGVAENHFHLNGSTKIFELNWICLMNHIENRGKDFSKFEYMIQYGYGIDIDKRKFYEMCQKAALYRIYLFCVIHHDAYLLEQLKKILFDIEVGGISIYEMLPQVQDSIDIARVLYGAMTEQSKILDYAIEKDSYCENNNASRLLSGERRFLYRCFKRTLETKESFFTEYDKNIFYRYLVIRTYFRSELIQVNRKVGFSNFGEYEIRKEYFVEGKKEYEYELTRLAINASFFEQNIVSLEARICPTVNSRSLSKKISKKLRDVGEDRIRERLFFVLHFPKQKEETYRPFMPKNAIVRKKTEKYANAIVALFEKGGEVNHFIRGIDACANEIGCRPEVFAQFYRYLLDYSIPMRENGDFHLMATYHAGEDFLDIVDGLRAIEEVMLFCGLYRGCRIGHALALGINPADYYQFKNNILVLPKQDLLDNITWLLAKIKEYGCPLEGKLESLLENKFYELFNEIYLECLGYNEMNYWDYYNSWRLRGDNPCNYLLSDIEFKRRLNVVPLRKMSRYEFNEKVSDTIRRTEKYKNLYKMYHYDRHVREEGAKRVVFKIPCGYAEIVSIVQDKMIQRLVDEGIGIETNPSSNYLIGTIKKYEEHPIIRFNGRKLKRTEVNMSLQVSLNTDDQGVFDTSLENEYALMTVALKKAKSEDNQYLYDMEDIYAWIDYVRRMGITQSFGGMGSFESKTSSSSDNF